jgi:hypothetical protein
MVSDFEPGGPLHDGVEEVVRFLVVGVVVRVEVQCSAKALAYVKQAFYLICVV